MTTVLDKATTTASSVGTSHAKRWWILAILGIAQLMVVLDSTVVNIALPTAQTDLGFSDGARQWIVTAYALAFGSLLLLGGRIADIVGRKWVFVVGLVGFAVASAIGGASVDVGMLIGARAVQGLFAALLAPAILSLLTTTFTDASERGKAFGIFGAIAGAGASVGLLLGGFLTEYANWRWTMFVNLIFAVIAFFGGMTLLDDSRAKDRPKLDMPGTVLVSAGLFSLVYGFSRAESDGWADTLTIVFLVLAAVLLVAFVVVQQRASHPLLPLRVVLDRNRGGALIAMFAASAGMFAVFLFLTYYLQRSQGYSAVQTGVAFLPMTGMVVVVASVGSTLLVTRVSSRILIPLGMLCAAVAMYLLTHISLDATYVANILPSTLLIGAGLGLVFAPAFSLATLGVSAHDSGVASANVNAMQQVGGSVGTALLNTIAGSAAIAYATTHKSGVTSAAGAQMLQANSEIHSYTTAFWWATGIFVIGAIISGIVLRPGVPDIDTQAAVAAI
jgi:EmrB/QacA subfamily drug resistance transporter